MDTQSICDELRKAIQGCIERTLTKYWPDDSESSLTSLRQLMVLKGIEVKVLDQMANNTKLDFDKAQFDYEGVLGESRCIASINRPRPSLPPEIIQYIISIAYREKRDNWDSIRELLSDTEGRTGRFLLSGTTLDVNLDNPDCVVFLENTHPLNLDVRLSDINDHTPIALQHASRWRTLKIQYSPHGSARLLITCKDALPYIENLVFKYCGPLNDDAFLKQLPRTLQLHKGNLRSATIPYSFLSKIVPSGFLMNIVDLHVFVNIDGRSFDYLLSMISHLPKLYSLELQDGNSVRPNNRDWGRDKFYSKAPAGRNRIGSLRELHLSYYFCEYAKLIIPWFSACTVNRFVASGIWFSAGADAFFSSLSNVFPQLDHLKINSKKFSGSWSIPVRSNAGSFFFPKLHTVEYSGSEFSVKELSDLIDAIRSRITPQARSSGAASINHLLIENTDYPCNYPYPRTSVAERELIMYELEQLVPNFVYI